MGSDWLFRRLGLLAGVGFVLFIVGCFEVSDEALLQALTGTGEGGDAGVAESGVWGCGPVCWACEYCNFIEDGPICVGGFCDDENTEEACSDGFSNDNDLIIDCADVDCDETDVCGGPGA